MRFLPRFSSQKRAVRVTQFKMAGLNISKRNCLNTLWRTWHSNFLFAPVQFCARETAWWQKNVFGMGWIVATGSKWDFSEAKHINPKPWSFNSTFFIRYPTYIISRFLIEVFQKHDSEVLFPGWKSYKIACEIFLGKWSWLKLSWIDLYVSHLLCNTTIRQSLLESAPYSGVSHFSRTVGLNVTVIHYDLGISGCSINVTLHCSRSRSFSRVFLPIRRLSIFSDMWNAPGLRNFWMNRAADVVSTKIIQNLHSNVSTVIASRSFVYVFDDRFSDGDNNFGPALARTNA